jgi:GxxExxY protein
MADRPHMDLTGEILKAAFQVSNTLGCGFLEKVYENSLVAELRAMGLHAVQQARVRVVYREQTVGDYIADVIVEGAVLIEIKATEEHHPIYVAQVLNYLRATRLPVALLVNFGRPKLKYRRFVLTEDGQAREDRNPIK